MSEKDRKRDAAMRLFGALSGVEEEYLAACEADAGKDAVNTLKAAADTGKDGMDTLKAAVDAGSETVKQKLMPFHRLGSFVRRYGTAVAAVLCVIMFGVSMAGYRLGGSKTMDSTQNGSMALQQQNTAGAVMDQEEAAPEEPDAASWIPENEGAGSSITDGITDRFSAKEVMQDDLKKEDAESSTNQDLVSKRLGSMESSLGNVKDVTLEQARDVKVVGEYLPEVFPESGAINVLYATDDEGQESITLGWNTDKAVQTVGWFYLTIENLGDSLPDGLDAGTVIEGEQLDGGSIEECQAMVTVNAAGSETSERTLSVLYENQGDYVLLTVYGEVSVEEIWKMLNSVKK